MKLNQALIAIFLVLLIPSAIKMLGGADYIITDEKSKLFVMNKDNIRAIRITKTVKGDDGKPKVGKDGKPETEQALFKRLDDEWIIGSGPYPDALKARADDIERRIIDKIEAIRVNPSSLIAEQASDAELEEYELQDDSATKVELFDANAQKPIVELLVGRPAGGAKHGANATTGSYVRQPKQKVVVLTDEEITLDTKLDDWVNKTILDVPEADITEIRLSNEKGQVQFKLAEPEKGKPKEWTVVKGVEGVGKLRTDKVTSLVGRARSITVSDFVEVEAGKPPKHGLNTPKVEVGITTKDATYVLKIGNKVEGKEDHYAVLQNKLDQVLLALAGYEVEAFQEDPKDFFDPKEEAKKPEEKKPEEKKGAGGNEKQPGPGPEKKDSETKDTETKDAEKKDAGKKNDGKKEAGKKEAGK